jgi:hypothetical protein
MKTSPFVREGYSDWSNVARLADIHVKTKSHVEAVEAASGFLKICK